MKLHGLSPVAAAIAMGALFVACEGDAPAPTQPDTPGPRFDKPPWAGGGGGGDDEQDPITVEFPDPATGFGIATSGAGDLTGANTADGITAKGVYSLVYTLPGGVCTDLPLVQLFDGEELNTTDFSLTLDKEADGNGNFDINDRIRVDSNGLSNPDGDDGFVYSVWFRSITEGYDPENDVTIDESDPAWTAIQVQNEDVFVRQLKCRNAKCNSLVLIDSNRCELEANYSLRVSK